MAKLPAHDLLAVAHVARPHGVRGELSCIPLAPPVIDSASLIVRRLFIRTPDGEVRPARGLAIRPHQDRWLVTLEGIDDRTQAETLRDLWVWIAPEQAAPLDEGEVYLHDMLELQVVTDEGEELGQIVQIIETGANPVYVVRGTQGELLLPDTDEVILDVDLDAEQVTVHLIEGLR